MVGVMEIMGASFKKDFCQDAVAPRTVVFSAPDPTPGHCRPMPPPETSGHSWASLAQSLVGPPLLSPGLWYTQALSVPSKSLFP